MDIFPTNFLDVCMHGNPGSFLLDNYWSIPALNSNAPDNFINLKISIMRANRIIIQDIDKDILDVIRYCLEELKFIVHPIQDSQNVLTEINDFKPDLILLDYKLSGRESIAACRQIKRANPRLPVLAMSCNPDIKTYYKAHRFDAYIKKPFDIYHLFSVLGKYCPRPINQLC